MMLNFDRTSSDLNVSMYQTNGKLVHVVKLNYEEVRTHTSFHQDMGDQ